MEVKPGYKQTEVGVIPEDWDVKPLRRSAVDSRVDSLGKRRRVTATAIAVHATSEMSISDRHLTTSIFGR